MPLGTPAQELGLVFDNEDSEPLTVGPATLSGPDTTSFPVNQADCSNPVAPGESCEVILAFSPTRVGALSATLTVPVEGDPEPVVLNVTGEGVASVRVTPALLDFGTLPVMTRSAPQQVVVENISGMELSGIAAALASRFSNYLIESDTCRSATLAPGATCTASVVYRAQTQQFRDPRLLIRKGALELASVALKGSVLVPPITPWTPDASAHLRKRIRAAIARMRRAGRRGLLRRGFVIRGLVMPVDGRLSLAVRARGPDGTVAALMAKRRLSVIEDEEPTLRARLTKAGRRLLRRGSRVVMDLQLSLIATSDRAGSEAFGVLRLPRRR